MFGGNDGPVRQTRAGLYFFGAGAAAGAEELTPSTPR